MTNPSTFSNTATVATSVNIIYPSTEMTNPSTFSNTATVATSVNIIYPSTEITNPSTFSNTATIGITTITVASVSIPGTITTTDVFCLDFNPSLAVMGRQPVSDLIAPDNEINIQAKTIWIEKLKNTIRSQPILVRSTARHITTAGFLQERRKQNKEEKKLEKSPRKEMSRTFIMCLLDKNIGRLPLKKAEHNVGDRFSYSTTRDIG
ncbi:hypothetical protein RRG08_066312 [Elysia crispata]|uniref:Uncharacterized protein n=1 Tax=Elysia crispata TaxID=231223 RepID=A0AAE1ANV9_9GAST|nr:hypothetical protein RRG08_066312 [Elysia crispata]